MKAARERLVRIASGAVDLEGALAVPDPAHAVVLFAHGSGSNRHSPRNNFVAAELRRAGVATLLLDLHTPSERALSDRRIDTALLMERLHDTVRWLAAQPGTRDLPVGLFGASSGAAAALQLAAAVPSKISAVVARGGRVDLAGVESLVRVKAPTLLVVAGRDAQVLELNEAAYIELHCPKLLVVVPGATHLFVEAGALEAVASHAASWFTRHLVRTTDASPAQVRQSVAAQPDARTGVRGPIPRTDRAAARGD